MERTKFTEPNMQNQIFSIKPAKLNKPNQFYQPQSREIKSTENQSIVQSKLDLSLAQLSPSLYYTVVLYDNVVYIILLCSILL